mmetsp:Transcript_9697/g.10427  ORF Transcript_9697/g.10427 Transcript_9697/m.10427 type:complete len:295 (-) Transcript_9697:2972-3856(-)|eukprot:gene2004-2140_t
MFEVSHYETDSFSSEEKLDDIDEFDHHSITSFGDDSSTDKDGSILVDHDLKVWALPKASRPKKNKYRKTELAKKRKANRAELTNYHVNYVPRIVKSDVRRQYGFMFASVYNHCDYDYMMKFIQTFVRPRSTVSSRRTGEFNESFISTECKTSSDFWFARMNDGVDIVITITDTQYTLRSDSTSRVECKFQLTGTKILSMPKQLLLSSYENPKHLAPEVEGMVLYYFHESMNFEKGSPPLEVGENYAVVTVKYTFEGELALDIDPECMITLIDTKSHWNYDLGHNINIFPNGISC